MYKVIYIDDLCYQGESFFETLELAKKWVKMQKKSWMRWKVYDEQGRQKSGGTNNKSYNGE